MALTQPCRQAFPSRWAAGEAVAAFSGTSSAAPGTASLPPGVAFFWRQRGVSPRSAAWGFGLTSRPARIRGCECRTRTACQATPEPRRVRYEPGQARPSRWAVPAFRALPAPERETGHAAPEPFYEPLINSNMVAEVPLNGLSFSTHPDESG